jgi:mRNA interferase MazF
VWLHRPARDAVGHEQMGGRPVVVVSNNTINSSPWLLHVVVPLTTRDRGVSLHVRIEPPDGGVREVSHALVEQVHAADRVRFVERWGVLSPVTMAEIADRLRIVLDL